MPSEFHGTIRSLADGYTETQKPALYVYNEVGATLQQYCTTREAQYIERMRDVWGMIDKGAQALNKHIAETW